MLEALLKDLERTSPDHVAVTGDLTNVGLAGEIEDAVRWLARLGDPARVSIVPGNHDAYAAPLGPERLAPWAPYLGDGGAGDRDVPGPAGFPGVRRAGPVALVGLCSAVPTAPGLATGRLGADQLSRLDARLGELGAASLCRVVLMHHPPVPAGQSRRRQLRDAAALRDVLARRGAELILHGHTHRTTFESVAGPGGPIAVVGVPSSSSRSPEPERRARYHLYRIERRDDGFELRCRARVLDPNGLRFVDGPEHAL